MLATSVYRLLPFLVASVTLFCGLVVQGQQPPADAFRGKQLVMWGPTWGILGEVFDGPGEPLVAMLQRKGFQVVVKQGDFDAAWLKEADQLWIFSGWDFEKEEIQVPGFEFPDVPEFKPDDLQAICRFVAQGRGLYLLADNEPNVREARIIAGELFGASVSGKYYGLKRLRVLDRAGRGGAPGQGQSDEQYYVPYHPLLKGVTEILEGNTISHITASDKLETVLVASDRQILACVAKDPKLKLVIDCGFTRYLPLYAHGDVTGALRFAENVAEYLSSSTSPALTAGQPMVTELRGGDPPADNTAGRRTALLELVRRQSSYTEIKDQIGDLQPLLESDDAATQQAVGQQLALAFQQAPIAHCLHWTANGTPALKKLVWAQVEARIARADETRRSGYRDTALQVALDSQFDIPSRTAALDLLARLKDPAAVRPVSEKLLDMPREIWGPVGVALKESSGQDFGPREGDQLAQVLAAAKKWSAWLKENPPR